MAYLCLLGISGREGDGESPASGVELAVLNRMARGGLTSQLTFDQRLERSKRGKPCCYRGSTSEARAKFLCKNAFSGLGSRIQQD